MRKVFTSKTFLSIMLFLVLAVTIIGRFQIGGWILVLGWWLIALFPIFHLILHVIYLLQIQNVKRNHLRIIFISHTAYFLFFIFQYDLGDGPIEIVITDFLKRINPSFSNYIYNAIHDYITEIEIFLGIIFLIAEIAFIVKMKKYFKEEIA